MDSSSHDVHDHQHPHDKLDCNHGENAESPLYKPQPYESILAHKYLAIQGDSTHAQLADTEEDLEFMLREMLPASDPLVVTDWARKLESLHFTSINNETIDLALNAMALMPQTLTANRLARPIKIYIGTTISELAKNTTVDRFRILLEVLSHFGQHEIFHDIPYKLVWPRTYSADDFAPKFPTVYIRIFGMPGFDITLEVSRSSDEVDKLTLDDIAAVSAWFIATRIELNRDCRRNTSFNAFKEVGDHKGRRFKNWMHYNQSLDCRMYRMEAHSPNNHYRHPHKVFQIDQGSRKAAAAAMSQLTHIEISSELMNSAFGYHLSSINNSFGGSLLKNVIGVTVHAFLRGATVSGKPNGRFVVDLRADCGKFRHLRDLLVLQFGSKPEKDTPSTLTLSCSAVDYNYSEGDRTQSFPAVNFRIACAKRTLNLYFTLTLCTPHSRPWNLYGHIEQAEIARKYVNAVRKKIYGMVAYGALDSSWCIENKLNDDPENGGETHELRP